MRVMIDANILISALLVQSGKRANDVMETIFKNHTLVISTYTKSEVFKKSRQKFPVKAHISDNFFAQANYELFQTPTDIVPDLFYIRDPKDYPVLYSAIVAGVDIFVTGDKDFAAVDIDKPKILTPAQFLDTYSTD
ncbi:MAG: putative toxin-antitoxin system toxin component, PIN family [Oscillospiraceae bacterium]|jgi:putative PIN family toxin of toxin-antitoxin system|nr:putative toxin-antitoxin system toxin component, PIN family [Oscillospiraceae bacterium]